MAAQFSVEPAGPCNAAGVADPVKASVGDGYRVKDAGGAPFVEVWLNKGIPTEKPSEAPRGSDYSNLSVGGFIGVIQYAKAAADFRGQAIKPGAYTMRFMLQPEDGDHQGASPRRDHLLLSPIAVDQDPTSKPNFDGVVAMSKKASGTNHPLVLFLVLPSSGAKFPSIESQGNKQVLQVKSGAVELGITVVGKAEE